MTRRPRHSKSKTPVRPVDLRLPPEMLDMLAEIEDCAAQMRARGVLDLETERLCVRIGAAMAAICDSLAAWRTRILFGDPKAED